MVPTSQGPVYSAYFDNIRQNLASRLKGFARRTVDGTLYVSHRNVTYTGTDEFIEIVWGKCPNCKSSNHQSVANEHNGFLDWRACDDCHHMWDPKLIDDPFVDELFGRVSKFVDY